MRFTGNIFSNTGNLYTHMRRHTGQLYKCAHCPFKSVNKGHLIEHQAIHNKTREVCKLCRRDYNTPKSLLNHVRKYHGHTAKGKEYLNSFQVGCRHVTNWCIVDLNLNKTKLSSWFYNAIYIYLSCFIVFQ